MLFLTSCDDDEDPEQDIVGDWKVESMEYTVTSSASGEVSGQTIDQSSVTEGEMTNANAFLNFTESTFTATGNYDIESTTTQNDPISGTVTSDLTSSFTDLNNQGTYTRNGNELTFTGSFMEFDFEVIDFDISGFDFGGIDFEELGIEFPDVEFEEFNLEDQTSTGTITSSDGSSMTMIFDIEETSVEQGITNSTVVQQTLVLTKQ